MNDIELTLVLTVDEINTILAALQEIPAKTANPLTRKIQLQAQPQLAEIQELHQESSE